ncbi:ABC transporter permease [Microbacterium sp. M3]|uniref:ABC transporter permease n=1 Tax=Microbacterium arthrosphaerae TaxID=792652 RepID=A0ABU4GXE8_9MICO|nr:MULTISPECIES: ABC transporter permease [Microbacterium]MDW4571757.1 ABC transporter permease [Microbacterium arthrosphaerae]MDW7605612.1 ABC transporter permease [Microbacterium sp. M3]
MTVDNVLAPPRTLEPHDPYIESIVDPDADPSGSPHAAQLDEERTDAASPRSALTPVVAVLKQPTLVASILVLALVTLWALVPSWFTAWDPIVGVPQDRLLPPSPEHLFGTDNLGRDLYARVVYGSATSLAATSVAVIVGLAVGSLFGLLAGFLRGFVDDAIMRFMDVLLAIPSLLLSLALITALGFGTLNVAIAVGLASIASFSRVMRAEVLQIATAVYVEAAHVSGVRWYTVLRRHVLPNASGPVVALAALEFGVMVLAISSLSFLGFGAPPPTPEWGSLVAGGRDYLAVAWWLTTFPGLVIVAVVLSANRISRALERNGGIR